MPELKGFLFCIGSAIALIGIGIVIGRAKWVENEDKVQEFEVRKKEKK